MKTGVDQNYGLAQVQRAGGWCEPVLQRIFPLWEPSARSRRGMPFTALTRDRFTVIWVATRSLPSHVGMGWEAFLFYDNRKPARVISIVSQLC